MAQDLYTQWLQVAPGPRPPNHYALLGLRLFCNNEQEIEEAAHKQLERLDRYAIHPDLPTRDACQRMMNEVARARVVLASPEKRAAYNSELMDQSVTGLAPPAKAADAASDLDDDLRGSALTRLAGHAHETPPVIEEGLRGVAEVVEDRPPPEPAPPEPVAELIQALAPSVPQAAEPLPLDLPQDLVAAAEQDRMKYRFRRRNSQRTLAVVVSSFLVLLLIGYGTLHMLRNGPQPGPADQGGTKQPDDLSPGGTDVGTPSHAVAGGKDHPPAGPGGVKPKPGGAATTPKTPEVAGVKGGQPAPAGTAPSTIPSRTPTVAATQAAPAPTGGTPAATPAGAPSAVASVDDLPKAVVPNAAALQAGLKLVESNFKDELAAAKTRDDFGGLAQKMLEAGTDPKNDVPTRFATLIKARDLAIQAGGMDMAVGIVTQLARNFQIDGVRGKYDVLGAFAAVPEKPATRAGQCQVILPVIDEAVQADRYDLAKPMADWALVWARDANDAGAIRQATARVLEVQQGAAAYGEERKAAAALAAKADDPDANLTVGLYDCLWRQDWPQGLKRLVGGSDAALRQLARHELDNPSDAAAQCTLGDEWWNYAEKQNSLVRQRMRAHAGVWYRQALPRLEGLTRDKVSQRLEVIGRMALGRAGGAKALAPASAPATQPAATRAAAAVTLGAPAGIVPVPRAAKGLLAIPGGSAQAAAEAQLQQTLADAPADNSFSGRVNLARQVWVQAQAAGEPQPNAAHPVDPAQHYVLLLEAVRLGSEIADPGRVARAADAMGTFFAVDTLDLKYQGLSHANAAANGGSQVGNLVAAAEEFRDESLEQRLYAPAARFAALAESLAAHSTDATLAAQVHAHNGLVTQWAQVQQALTTLEGQAADPAAHLAVGRYLCFVGGDWAGGLKHLAQGSDAGLKQLATQELTHPSAAAEQKTLADGWWDCAQKQAKYDQMRVEYHADIWYRRALVTGLPAATQSDVAARLANLAKYKTDLPPIGQQPDDPRLPDAQATLLTTLDTNGGAGKYHVAYSGDGRQIIAFGGGRCWVWESANGELTAGPLVVSEKPVGIYNRFLFLDARATKLVAVGGGGRELKVWDIATQKQIGATISGADMIDGDLSPDGRAVVTAHGTGDLSYAVAWDLNSGKTIGEKMAHKERITCVRYSADGKYLVTASLDKTCRVWNALTGALICQLAVTVNPDDMISGATFDPAGKRVAVLLRSGQLVLCDAAGGQVLLHGPLGTQGYAVTTSPNGAYLATCGTHGYRYAHAQSMWGGAQVFDLSTGKLVSGLLKHDTAPAVPGTEAGAALNFSQDCRYVVTTSGLGKTARVWDLRQGGALVVRPLEHLQTVSAAAFDPTGHRVVTVCVDGTIRVWQLPG